MKYDWITTGWGDWIIRTLLLCGAWLIGIVAYINFGGEVRINLPQTVLERAIERAVQEAVAHAPPDESATRSKVARR